MPTGLRIVDDLLSPAWMVTGLRIALVLLSIGAGYMCFRTGDLGAKAVWARDDCRPPHTRRFGATGAVAAGPGHALDEALIAHRRPAVGVTVLARVGAWRVPVWDRAPVHARRDRVESHAVAVTDGSFEQLRDGGVLEWMRLQAENRPAWRIWRSSSGSPLSTRGFSTWLMGASIPCAIATLDTRSASSNTDHCSVN